MGRKRIGRALIVEDDPAWRQIISELLVDYGLTVDIASSLDEAVQHLKQSPHRVAVIDLALEGQAASNQDGLRVLEAVQRQDPGCVAIMLTGYATVELAVQALTEYRALTCLEKGTFDRTHFRDLLRKALSVAPVSASGNTDVEQPHRQRVAMDVGRKAAAPLGAALVVEDEAGWREIISELLSEAGYWVRLCSGYGEAVGYLNRERFGIAIVDLSLSDIPRSPAGREELSGYDLLARMQELAIATVVVSGVLTQEDIRRVYGEYGVYACLEKQTFDRQAFLQIVTEARERDTMARGISELTAREVEVLRRLVQGMTNKEIAEALVISPNTVKRHLRAIFDKLGVHTRAAAVMKAAHAGYSLSEQRIGEAP